jgi:hypothetical protein
MTFTLTAVVLGTRSARFGYGCTKIMLSVKNSSLFEELSGFSLIITLHYK